MGSSGHHEAFTAALERWRQGCIFYFKLDAAIIAALSAGVSYLKLKGDELLLAVHDQHLTIYWLAGLTLYSLVYELSLTQTLNQHNLAQKCESAKWLRRAHLIFGGAYNLQVVGHIFFLYGIVSFLLGFADGAASILTK